MHLSILIMHKSFMPLFSVPALFTWAATIRFGMLDWVNWAILQGKKTCSANDLAEGGFVMHKGRGVSL